MSNLMTKAATGNQKAMLALLDSNKNKVYAFCSTLLQDAKAAEKATTDVFAKAWTEVQRGAVSVESDFTALLMQLSVQHCAGKLLGKNLTAAFATRPSVRSAAPYTNTDFMGNVDKGLAAVKKAVAPMERNTRFVFLASFAGDLSIEELAEAMKLDADAIKAYVDAGIAEYTRQADAVKIGLLVSLFKQAAERPISESLDKACRAEMDQHAKANAPTKKIAVAVIAAIVLIAVLCVVLVFTMGNDNATHTTDSTSSIGSTQTDTDTASTVSVDYTSTMQSVDYIAEIDIADYGTITVELDATSAPETVANFVNLAQSGFYDGLTFHRIKEGFMMQGGDPNGNGTGGSDTTITGEFADNGVANPLTHTRGAISMARSNDYNSASSQFFIVHEDSTFLDGQYAVFGYVCDGMEIVDRICTAAEPTDGNGTIEASEQPIINSITVREA